MGLYSFSVVVSKDAGLGFTARSASTSVQVEIVPGSPPVVSIENLAKIKLNTDDWYLSVTGLVTSDLALSTRWTMSDGDVE